jgi:CDP-diacylglycerol--glycerol-3-phosphate 3-phosphatidyltransferase
MRVTIPTGLTLGRVAAIPLLIVAFYIPGDVSHLVSAILFALASITDWLDGYLARRWKQTSSFGAFLDPVADKVLVAVALILLLQADPRVLLAVPMAIIIGREITISSLREWMAMLGERTSVAVTQVAKFKTTFQMFAIGFMLWQRPEFGIPVYEVGVALLLIAAALTIWTMAMYLKAAWPILRKGMTPGP